MREYDYTGIKRREENGMEHITVNAGDGSENCLVIFAENSVFTRGWFPPELKKATVEKALECFAEVPVNAPRAFKVIVA